MNKMRKGEMTMTQEDKILLLKDLCARLPYNVKVSYERIPPPGWKMSDTHIDGYLNSIEPNWSITNGYQPNIICSGTLCGIGDVKPYLRPMLSMTEEERLYFHRNSAKVQILVDEEKLITKPFYGYTTHLFDWLNSHHFDYRNLIKKGLAIEAPEGMYDIK